MDRREEWRGNDAIINPATQQCVAGLCFFKKQLVTYTFRLYTAPEVFFVYFRFLPGKKRGGREQDVDQFLTALRSACLQNDGTIIRFIKSKSRLSGCPAQITSASFKYKDNN